MAEHESINAVLDLARKAQKGRICCLRLHTRQSSSGVDYLVDVVDTGAVLDQIAEVARVIDCV